MRDERWPREYATDIAKLETKDQRRKAFEQVPEHFKPMVRDYLESMFRLRSAREARDKARK